MAETIITVDKFLGLNESTDGTTELKPGEATRLENFLITDDYNMRTRPGIVRYHTPSSATEEENFCQIFSVYEKEKCWLGCVVQDTDSSYKLEFFHKDDKRTFVVNGPIKSVIISDRKVIIVWQNASEADSPDTGVPSTWRLVCSYLDIENGMQEYKLPYEPLLLSECAPSGGGETIEFRNILSDRYRVGFKADERSTAYVLPDDVDSLTYIDINGVKEESLDTLGTYDAQTHTFHFFKAPLAGDEIIFGCITNDRDLFSARNRFFQMKYHEYYNGATDTRIFFYGDGSNISYYTGVPAHGTGLYIPEGNELAVNFSDSPITGMIRHYSRLLAFKPDGVESITYEPVTLEDGSVIAGFYLRPVSRAFGNDAMAQLCLVNNSPRSFTSKSIYEWRVSSSSYRDERYAKNISQKVSKTLAAADPAKVVACDDDASKTYYVFLNDDAGTVLVNCYDQECWTIYRSPLTTGVTQAICFEGKLLFLQGGKLFTFDEEALYDDENVPIQAHYESGFQSFGADYKRKYSSRLWLSLLPESASSLDITVKTDKRGEYLTKTVGYSLFGFSRLDFSNFTFQTYSEPKMKRIQLKVKKFVYYKLILKVTQPGARATVLGYDQQIRYSSNVK